jgi:hypothetical protein
VGAGKNNEAVISSFKKLIEDSNNERYHWHSLAAERRCQQLSSRKRSGAGRSRRMITCGPKLRLCIFPPIITYIPSTPNFLATFYFFSVNNQINIPSRSHYFSLWHNKTRRKYGMSWWYMHLRNSNEYALSSRGM